MKAETTHGCLFHAAVASAPHDEKLRALLERHKAEMAERAARISGLQGREAEISVIIEECKAGHFAARNPSGRRRRCELLSQTNP
jgi:hypothetical protein